jgi:hypothetical protein
MNVLVSDPVLIGNQLNRYECITTQIIIIIIIIIITSITRGEWNHFKIRQYLRNIPGNTKIRDHKKKQPY